MDARGVKHLAGSMTRCHTPHRDVSGALEAYRKAVQHAQMDEASVTFELMDHHRKQYSESIGPAKARVC
jgi:hypothetical protein